MLNALETGLGVTDTGYPALGCYQLRREYPGGRELPGGCGAARGPTARRGERRRHACPDAPSGAPARRSAGEVLMREIESAQAVIQGRANMAQEIASRTERIKQVARYRGPTDTAPTTDSLAFSEGDVMAKDPVGVSSARMPNVLAEDTWD